MTYRLCVSYRSYQAAFKSFVVNDFFRIDIMWESLARFYAAETKSGKCLVAVYKCKRKRKKKKDWPQVCLKISF